jgi:hypothetical protein
MVRAPAKYPISNLSNVRHVGFVAQSSEHPGQGVSDVSSDRY